MVIPPFFKGGSYCMKQISRDILFQTTVVVKNEEDAAK
jgi:hypothetical protein